MQSPNEYLRFRWLVEGRLAGGPHPDLSDGLASVAGFLRADAPPVVHVRAHRDDDTWVLEVEDEGIGIDPRFRDEVFRMFRRLNARRSYAGTGIGLSITQRIVERHGGTITVGDPTGTHGTRIVVRLPDRPEVAP